MSNNGRVGVGVIACRESMPDVDDLAQPVPGRAGAATRGGPGPQAVTSITKAKSKTAKA